MLRFFSSLIRIGTGVIGAVVALLLGLWLVFAQPSARSIQFSAEGRASAERLEEHVRYLATTVVPRDSDHPENLARAADYIHAAFSSGNARVWTQDYVAHRKNFRNVVASFGPAENRRFILGAHYDAVGGLGENPGADDNASGTATLLELARLLSVEPPAGRVDLVAFSTEEPPFFGSRQMGSSVHARSLREGGAEVRGMISIEMIGYYTNRQPWPHWLYNLFYPETGDFIGVVGRLGARKLTRFTKACFRGVGSIATYSFNAPATLGLDASDQLSYWNVGYPAVMVTDTAFRNPNYHAPGDTPETLDYRRMAAVVDGLFNVALNSDELEPLLPDPRFPAQDGTSYKSSTGTSPATSLKCPSRATKFRP